MYCLLESTHVEISTTHNQTFLSKQFTMHLNLENKVVLVTGETLVRDVCQNHKHLTYYKVALNQLAKQS